MFQPSRVPRPGPGLGADTSQALRWEAWLPSIVLRLPRPRGGSQFAQTGEAVCIQRYCDLRPWLPAGAVEVAGVGWLRFEIIW